MQFQYKRMPTKTGEFLRGNYLNSHKQEDIKSYCPNVRVYSLHLWLKSMQGMMNSANFTGGVILWKLSDLENID